MTLERASSAGFGVRSGMSRLVRQSLDATISELADEFSGVFSRETVARYVEDSYEAIGERPTVGPNFLPVIIQRFSHERLWAVAQADGLIEKALPEVLFVCERNAGRSQIAAALADHLSNGWVGVRCAGSRPEEQIDPVVVEALAELDVDVTHEFPKPLTDEVVRAADAIITLGCGDACPVYPGRRYQDWPVADPAGRPLAAVRKIRYEIYHRVWDLRFELGERKVHLVHGSPRKVNEYLFEDKPASLYERLAAAESDDVLVFGHTHKPWIHEFGGVLFVNCGSVGKPKDGDPRGAFAILELDESGRVRASIERVPYDAEAVAREVEAAGLPGEYAKKLVAAA